MSLAKRVPAALVAALLLGALPALADEGVTEINQAVVDAAGGFPFSISTPGSYRLTGNLTHPAPALQMQTILITAGDVDLDLNGFRIVGPVTCTGEGSTLSCANRVSNANGIFISGDGVHVHDGTVRGSGGSGITIAGDNAVIENVRLIENGGYGLVAANTGAPVRTTVRRSGAYRNQNGALFLRDESASIENLTTGCGNGVELDDDGFVLRTVSTNHSFRGIETEKAVTIRESLVSGNGNGINLDSLSAGGSDPGALGSTVTSGNGQFDLRFGGTVGPVEIAPNICGTNTTCP